MIANSGGLAQSVFDIHWGKFTANIEFTPQLVYYPIASVGCYFLISGNNDLLREQCLLRYTKACLNSRKEESFLQFNILCFRRIRLAKPPRLQNAGQSQCCSYED